jgi:hypothetical protein
MTPTDRIRSSDHSLVVPSSVLLEVLSTIVISETRVASVI